MRAGFIALLVGLSASLVSAETVGYRLDGSGVYPGAAPTQWGPNKNVVWSTNMPDWGNGAPLVIGDHIFTTAEPDKLICLDRNTGKILWSKSNSIDEILTDQQKEEYKQVKTKLDQINKQIGELEGQARPLRRQMRNDPVAAQKFQELEKQIDQLRDQSADLPNYYNANTNRMNGYGSQTPVSDGKHVWVLFGHGVTACYDMEGNRKWAVFVEHANDGRGQGSSPVLVDGKVLVHYNRLIALNAETGEREWVCRDSVATFGTSLITTVGSQTVALTPDGCIVRIDDGKVLADGLWYMKFGNPTLHDGIVYGAEAGNAFAVKLAEAGQGVKTTEVWTSKIESKGRARNYGGPVVHEGVFFTVDDGGTLNAVDMANGQTLWTEKLQMSRTVYGLVMAGEHIYICDDQGKVEVFKADPTKQRVATNNIEAFRGTPTAADGDFYLRGLKKFYRIGHGPS